MPRPKRQRRRPMAAVAGIRGFREALQVRWRARGCRRTGVYDGRPASGFWSGVGPSLHCSRRLIHCRLPHPTAYRFLLPLPSSARRTLAIAPRSLVHPLSQILRVSFVLLRVLLIDAALSPDTALFEIISVILSQGSRHAGPGQRCSRPAGWEPR